MQNRNFLQAQAVNELRKLLRDSIDANEPADGDALKLLMDALYDSTTQMKSDVYEQVLSGMGPKLGAGGQLTGAVTVTGGGTGYAVGDKMTVSGATSGVGGVIVVTGETAGVIDTCEIWSVGDNYVGALTVNVAEAGNGDATLAMASAATYEDQTAIAELQATLLTTGTASAVAVNAGGTGYTEDDVLTLANGIVITVGVTTGAVTSVKSIDTNVANLDANATAVACTGGTGGDDATFDVTAVVL